jgi:hypothetical protein
MRRKKQGNSKIYHAVQTDAANGKKDSNIWVDGSA